MKLVLHPEYKLPQFQSHIHQMKLRCIEALDKLEAIKPILVKQFLDLENRLLAEKKFLLEMQKSQQSVLIPATSVKSLVFPPLASTNYLENEKANSMDKLNEIIHQKNMPIVPPRPPNFDLAKLKHPAIPPKPTNFSPDLILSSSHDTVIDNSVDTLIGIFDLRRFSTYSYDTNEFD
jgi:hypothetical protein